MKRQVVDYELCVCVCVFVDEKVHFTATFAPYIGVTLPGNLKYLSSTLAPGVNEIKVETIFACARAVLI